MSIPLERSRRRSERGGGRGRRNRQKEKVSSRLVTDPSASFQSFVVYHNLLIGKNGFHHVIHRSQWKVERSSGNGARSRRRRSRDEHRICFPSFKFVLNRTHDFSKLVFFFSLFSFFVFFLETTIRFGRSRLSGARVKFVREQREGKCVLEIANEQTIKGKFFLEIFEPTNFLFEKGILKIRRACESTRFCYSLNHRNSNKRSVIK